MVPGATRAAGARWGGTVTNWWLGSMGMPTATPHRGFVAPCPEDRPCPPLPPPLPLTSRNRRRAAPGPGAPCRPWPAPCATPITARWRAPSTSSVARRRYLAPLGYIAGGFALLFDGLKLLILNWRLTLIEIVPALWIWFTFWDLKAHYLKGRELYLVRGPLALAVAAVVVLITVAAYWCNAVFAFAVSGPRPPLIRPHRRPRAPPPAASSSAGEWPSASPTPPPPSSSPGPVSAGSPWRWAPSS